MDAKTTGRIINAKRKEKGLTQIQLAELLNVSNRAVSKWENGDGFPDITLLPIISKELDITIDELLTGIKPEPVIKVVESSVSKKDKLINDFKIGFVASLFMAIFAALLGSITELYCIWAFPILFYTHWEIMFAAVSLFSIVVGNLVFFVSITRLHLQFSKIEIINLSARKGLILIATSVIFPLIMFARIIDVSRWGYFTPYIMIAITAVLVFIIIKGYKKIKGIGNEKINENN
ncbi:MAG: helix-turn-helix domain-containing protein [Eubacterium sp.]|nr:helix-turn-helix domain-containing protein [Eubacterium sp.]MDE6155855.1 helix-turn-helix domain-containing protein [Eubacterium sp.]